MTDNPFDHPRLAAVYDTLDGDRDDLDLYVRIAHEIGARRVVDLGCGTGTLALMLAERGLEVVGIDPARAMLAVAEAKPGAEGVRWIHGDASALPPLDADLATMTGNAAQSIADEDEWSRTLDRVHAALRPGGVFVFETRDPARLAWEEWTREKTYGVFDIPGVGPVESWDEVIEVRLPLVTFRGVLVFSDEVVESVVTLRFRERGEVEAALRDHGFVIDDVRDAPDRPGRELVFLARRSE